MDKEEQEKYTEAIQKQLDSIVQLAIQNNKRFTESNEMTKDYTSRKQDLLQRNKHKPKINKLAKYLSNNTTAGLNGSNN